MKTRGKSIPRATQPILYRHRVLLGCLAFAFIAIVCQPRAFAQETSILVGSGSSVPAPLYAQWAAAYNKRNPAIQMRYLPIGASEGINEMSRGNGDFGAGEVALTAAQRNGGSLIEVPILVIGIVPIYNLAGVSQGLHLSGEVLAEIYLGEIKNWSDPQLKKLNPSLSLPDLPIKVFNRPAGKGSNYVFTDFLSKSSGKFKSRIGTTASPSWPVGSAAERSADMADKIKGESGSIGYVELQYAVKSGIPTAAVLNPAGNYVKASADSIAASCRQVEAPSWDKFSASLANAPGAESFPITGFSWLYLRTSSPDSRRAAAMANLLEWMFTDGEQLAAQEGYSELPQQLLSKVKAKVNSLR